MASTIVRHTCLEPQVIEPFVIQQALTPPKVQETNNRAWTFLRALENPSMHSKNDKHDEVYVHPIVRRSTSALSGKSLEMCTESLGSETGSDISSEEFNETEYKERVKFIKSKYRNFDRKIPRNDFPPPLTSISGNDGNVKVNHHRENGRLVIKAVSYSNCGTNFQTERIDGRLKLSLLTDYCVNYESEGDEMEKIENTDDVESDGDGVADEVVVAAEEEGVNGGGWRWDMDGNRWRMAGKVTRCKERGNGNKVFANWRSPWVAIS